MEGISSLDEPLLKLVPATCDIMRFRLYKTKQVSYFLPLRAVFDSYVCFYSELWYNPSFTQKGYKMALGDMTKNLIEAFNNEKNERSNAHSNASKYSAILGVFTCGLSCFCFFTPACGESTCSDEGRASKGQYCCYEWPKQLSENEQGTFLLFETVLRVNLALLKENVADGSLSPLQALREETWGIQSLLTEAQRRQLLPQFASRDKYIRETAIQLALIESQLKAEAHLLQAPDCWIAKSSEYQK
ncbi:MAG: hypothetical protein ACHP65_05600 [Legionellales bacterium]